MSDIHDRDLKPQPGKTYQMVRDEAARKNSMTELDRESLARALMVTVGDLDTAGANSALLATDHRGDCTNEAYTCQRCYADEHRSAAKAVLQDIERQGFQITKRGSDG